MLHGLYARELKCAIDVDATRRQLALELTAVRAAGVGRFGQQKGLATEICGPDVTGRGQAMPECCNHADRLVQQLLGGEAGHVQKGVEDKRQVHGAAGK